MASKIKKKSITVLQIPIEEWEISIQKHFNKERTKANSEYHMQNFSHSDTAAYLERANRKDSDPEKLYLDLNRAVLARDLMMDSIVTGERCSPQINNAFKDDLAEIIKHTRKLCALLGVDKNGEIEIHKSGVKALYPHTKTKINKNKLDRRDNLHWGMSSMALNSGQKWGLPTKVLKCAHSEHPFSSPFFTNRVQEITQDINFLRTIAENIQNDLQGDQVVMDSDYYRKGVSFGMTPEQWILGRKLPEIYEEFFGATPNISRSRTAGDKLDGERLDFFMWCLERMKISLTKETALSYYYKHRIGSKAKKTKSSPM